MTLLAQISPPAPGQEAWPWVAAAAVSIMIMLGGVVGAVFWYVVGSKDKDITRLTEEKKELATELSKTTGSLEKVTNVVERQSQIVSDGFSQQREGFAAIDRRLAEVLDVIAPRQRTS